MIDFANELRKGYSGDAWHGNSIAAIISSVSKDQIFRRPIPTGHTIAELILHLTSWTEEVFSRLEGNLAKEPERGDWPLVKEETMQEWNAILSDFRLANEKLLNLVMEISGDQWETPVHQESGSRLNYFELFNGLVQHHAYHAGQISLLLKF
nr:DinB family protein [Pedobacter panaciterrae]